MREVFLQMICVCWRRAFAAHAERTAKLRPRTVPGLDAQGQCGCYSPPLTLSALSHSLSLTHTHPPLNHIPQFHLIQLRVKPRLVETYLEEVGGVGGLRGRFDGAWPQDADVLISFSF